MIDALAQELGTMLRSPNYRVFLRVYVSSRSHAEDVDAYVDDAISSPTLVDEIATVSKEEILKDVEAYLCYPGDFNLDSFVDEVERVAVKGLIERFLNELSVSIDAANVLRRFHFIKGHPGYPVFWEFAYLVANPDLGLVLVGCASD